MRLLLVIAIATGLNVSAGSAVAAGCTVTTHDFKKSVMEAKVCQGRLTITYQRPREALIKRGVRKGTILFTGTEQGDGSIKGHVRDFPSSCPSLAYSVIGSRLPKSIILVVSRYQKRDKSCQVTRYKQQKLVLEVLAEGGSP